MCEFTHDLICRVAYELLPAPRRETLHQRAARAWEGKARRNPAAQTALAYHRGRAGLSERAPWWKRRAVVAGAVAALVAVLAGTVWLLRPRPSIPVIASRVAVFPFPVQGAGAYNFLGEGMVDLLSSKLDGAGELKRVDPAKVFAAAGKNGVAVDNLERASETAARIGAGLFVTGRVLQLGSRLHIEASLYDRRTPDLAEFHTSVEDDASRAPELVDQLAVQLLAARGTPRAADARRVALSTTKSLPALRAYLEGEQLLRGRQFEPATKAFQRAVAADSLFALAYYRLAVAAMWDDDTELEHDAIETAVRLGTRLPDPVRLFARGLMAWWKGDVSEAEQLFRSSLSLDPEQAEAWYFLGETQLHLGLMNGEPLSDSREAFEMTVSLDSSNAEARWHLIQLAAMDERFADVESLLNRAHPDGNRDKYWDAVTAFGRGTDVDRTRAIETLSRSSLDDAWLAVLMVNMFFDDFDAMEPLVQVLLVPSRPAEVRANGYVWLAHMDLARGRWRSAKGRLEQAARHDPATAIEMQAYLMGLPFVSASEEELRSTLQRLRVWDAQRVPKSLPHPWFSLHDGLHPSLRLYYLGTLGARLGQVEYVVRSVNALEAADTSPSRESLRSNLARTLRAMLAERRGGPAAALAVVKTPRKLLNTELVTFSPFYSQADERYLRAEWLHQTGARDEALRWYTSLAESPPYGFVFRGPSYMRRAEIYEARGDSALAVEYYGRFVKMWKDCDPELRPMVAKAEQKLLALSR